MRRLFIALALTSGASAVAQEDLELVPEQTPELVPELEMSLKDLVPSGYVVMEKVYGDLNKDDQKDVVLMIKATDPKNMVIDELRGELDLNRRGIVVGLRNNQRYQRVIDNRNCFYSDDEHGGVYFIPDIYMTIERGSLFVNYAHGRYGHWNYNFRFQEDDFELIGYDSSSNRGPIVEVVTSINFLSKRKLVKDNINDGDEFADPVFKEHWTSFELDERIKLSEIRDFTELGERLP